MRKRLQELQRERASASLAAAVDDAAPVARACSRWLATLVLRPASSLMSMGPLHTDDYAVLLGHGSGNDSRAAAATGVRVSAATAQRRRGAEGKPRASQYSASSSLSMRTRHAVTCTCTRARSSGGRALLSGKNTSSDGGRRPAHPECEGVTSSSCKDCSRGGSREQLDADAADPPVRRKTVHCTSASHCLTSPFTVARTSIHTAARDTNTEGPFAASSLPRRQQLRVVQPPTTWLILGCKRKGIACQ